MRIKNNKVIYRKKTWQVEELLDFLVEENKKLKKQICKPGLHCIFDAEDELYKKTVELIKKDPDYTEGPYYG